MKILWSGYRSSDDNCSRNSEAGSWVSSSQKFYNVFIIQREREPSLALAQQCGTGLRAYLKQGSDLSVIPLWKKGDELHGSVKQGLAGEGAVRKGRKKQHFQPSGPDNATSYYQFAWFFPVVTPMGLSTVPRGSRIEFWERISVWVSQDLRKFSSWLAFYSWTSFSLVF